MEKGAAGWETYTSGEVTTAATTIYVYAEKGTKSSNIVNFTTGAGTAITLNAPTVYVNNLIANGSYYNAQFGAWYNTAGVEFTPDAELSATFAPEGGSPSNVTLPYTATQKGTLTITSTADGFTSAQTVLSVPGLYEQSWQSVDFSSLSGTDAIGTAVSGTWTLLDSHGRWASWADGTYNFYQHGTGSSSTVTVNDKIRMREVVVLAEGMGLGRNVTSGENISVITTTGQIVGFEMYNGYGAAINKGVNTYKTYGINTSGNPSVGVTNGALLVQATIYAPATLTLADGDAIHLTFNNATLGTGTAYGENWKIDFYSGNTKVANARADWWDDVANNNSGYTYGYTYSSDGGATADNTNVWGTYMSDMADADIDLTLSNSEGTLYVIGTMTKGEKVYYVNFAKSGLSGNLTYNLYGNNATLSNITTTDASVVTTPVHPTNVAVTLGSNGYATYANNVYPLDLTSAKAYKAAVDSSKVKFTLFEQAVPAGTGMLVEGTPSGTVNLPIADASTAVTGNEFLVNASGAVFDAESGYNYFALIKDSNPLTFGTFAPGTLAFPANKTYLKVAASAGARLLAVFGDDETTGISQMESGKLNIENAVYNLNGQRVAQPTKGLYIVGGKKVMMK
ncbi:MAG: hypothetical protein J6I52_01790 [Prevotella sp.]|nr:hypothetical protein [Prevotella sp.]